MAMNIVYGLPCNKRNLKNRRDREYNLYSNDCGQKEQKKRNKVTQKVDRSNSNIALTNELEAG